MRAFWGGFLDVLVARATFFVFLGGFNPLFFLPFSGAYICEIPTSLREGKKPLFVGFLGMFFFPHFPSGRNPLFVGFLGEVFMFLPRAREGNF